MGGRVGRGYSGVQVTEMIEWEEKSKFQKIPWASNETQKKSLDQKLTPPKIPCRVFEPWKFPKTIKWYNMLYFFWLYFKVQNYEAGIRRHYHESSWLFWIPKEIPTQIKPPKNNTCPIFLAKKFPKWKISNPSKSFDHPRYFRSGVPPPRIIIVVNVCENSINIDM